MATAVIALIFVFLLGTATVVSALGVKETTDSLYLYHFLFNGYEEIGEALDSVSSYSSYYAVSLAVFVLAVSITHRCVAGKFKN